jgi:23S rRNA pseudouridine2605 synthase
LGKGKNINNFNAHKYRERIMPELRLNKAIASAGICSRRKADERILAGAVTVNGVLVTEPGTKVHTERDTVYVDGKKLEWNTVMEPDFTWLMLHKPIHVVSTANDPQRRATVLDFVPEEYRDKRLYPVGRLDYFSEGLLLLTDDGKLTNLLTHPSHHLPKRYMVKLRENVPQHQIARMRRGFTLADGAHLRPMGADVDADDPRTLLLTLYQGINRQIRRMCRDFGLTILTLRRTGFGPLNLGKLPKGDCRPLTEFEVAALRKAVRNS